MYDYVVAPEAGTVRVAAVPMPVRDGDVEWNLDVALTTLSRAPTADVYLLPELCTTGYCGAEWPALADRWTEETVTHFETWARSRRVVLCAPTLARRDDGALVNRLWVLGADVRRSYDKMHLFPPLAEPDWLGAGDAPVTFAAGGITLGVSLCYDLRFPAVYGRQARNGAGGFLVAAAWPAERHTAMRALAAARAAETQSWVVVCNRAGADRHGLRFGGGSLVASPDGAIVDASGDETAPVVAVIASDDIARRRAAMPVLRDALPAFD